MLDRKFVKRGLFLVFLILLAIVDLVLIAERRRLRFIRAQEHDLLLLLP